MGTSPVAKPSEIGYEEMYGFIKEGVLHPLPAFSQVQSGTGRLFEISGDLYFMSTSGIYKRNGSTFALFISHAFNNSPAYWDMKPFFDPIATGAVSLTYASSTDQSITVTNTMPINKYVNKHVIIGNGTNQCLYITGSDVHTLYTDGLINGDSVSGSVTVNVYEQSEVLIIYDGATVHRFWKSDGSSAGTADSFTNGFIEVFSNRLFLMKGNTITFSTFNSSIFLNSPFNNLSVDGTIVDKIITNNALIVFTTQGTYGLNGTGYTTMNFPKLSEFSPHTRVYPIIWTDNVYLIFDGYVRQFTLADGLLQTQYNYAVIPDTQTEIFSIERGIVFPLGHGTTKHGIINTEELQNRKIISISNFYDNTITDMIEYKGVIFIIEGGVIWIQNGITNPRLKMNPFRNPKKMFRDSVDIHLGGTYPASVVATLDGVAKTCLKNDGANQVSYPIRDMGYAIAVSFTTTDPISSFNINYKI